MTGRQEEYYVCYDGDFGLTGLAAGFALASPPDDERAALGFVTAYVDAYDAGTPVDTFDHLSADERSIFGWDTSHDEWGCADDLHADVRTLVEAPLSDDTIRTVWRVAAGGAWDPAEHGISPRDWLRRVGETCAARPHRQIPGRRPASRPEWDVRPPTADTVRDDVLAEIRACRERAGSSPSPDTLGALEEVAVHAHPELAFRLLLRALKVCSVRIDREQWYDRLHALGERFGYCRQLIDGGLDVAWLPIDPARRDATWDFGFSRLAGKAHQEWAGSREDVETLAGEDDCGQTPGSAAAVLLDDVFRLLRSGLPDAALVTLWAGAADREGSPRGREWLRLIEDVCRERLREVAPAYTPVVVPARTELADMVLRELRAAAPALADKAADHRRPGSVTGISDALEHVVTRIDPDLGFRLFVRVLMALSVPLTPAQYERCLVLGECFGYGAFHVSDVDHLVETD
ncbi:hypothetical protein [Streptomyces sp. NPDC048200]|uniref:hypothetical protein n=1 Tax=Streptomyces sp. NPDC048200 TaxID=3365512 RepID=UPI0037183B70